MSGAFPRPSRGAMLAIDLALVGWVVVWVMVGVAVAREVEQLTELSATVEVAAGAIEETGDVLGLIGGVPFIGPRVGELAQRIEATGTSARRSAGESRESVRSLSRLLGLAVAATPSLLLLAVYLPLRAVWQRDAAAIRRALRRDPGDAVLEEYLARRAVAALPYARLRRVSENPWRDLEERRFGPLADAELARLGLRRPPR